MFIRNTSSSTSESANKPLIEAELPAFRVDFQHSRSGGGTREARETTPHLLRYLRTFRELADAALRGETRREVVDANDFGLFELRAFTRGLACLRGDGLAARILTADFAAESHV